MKIKLKNAYGSVLCLTLSNLTIVMQKFEKENEEEEEQNKSKKNSVKIRKNKIDIYLKYESCFMNQIHNSK